MSVHSGTLQNGIQWVGRVVRPVAGVASLWLGAPGGCTDLGVLEAGRATEPEAYLVYKPHPDVSAGLCRAGEGEEIAQECCDEVLTSGSIDQLFTQIEALHVLTSLAGVEAIGRGLEVQCWGGAVGAGWGVTRDGWEGGRGGGALERGANIM